MDRPMTETTANLSLARIAEAATVIDPVFRDSPQLAFDPLSRELGAEVVLKVETLNPIRSFKGRGGDYFVHCLLDKAPLVVASAGNFGQGVAYAATRRGIPLTVFTAETANPMKIARMLELGAEVILAGEDFDAAKAAARAHAREHNQRFVEDGREAPISEGAGSMAVELLRWPRPFDAVLVALGNGALINGIGTWVKAHAPATRVIGICATGAPAMEMSWRSGKVETTPTVNTISDGIGVRVPVPQALQDMRGIVDEVLLVDDATTLRAMRLLLLHTGLVVEPSGAVGVATILTHPRAFAGQLIATPLCGSNVSREQFKAWFTDDL
jgi:threonine dehydratase